MLEQSGLEVCFGAQPILLGTKLNPNDIDEEGRKAAEEVLIEAVDEAEYLGAKGIRLQPASGRRKQRFGLCSQLLKTTRAVYDHAAKKG